MPHTLEIQVTKPKGKSSEYHVRLATPDGHSLAEGDFTYRLDPLSVLTELERLPWEFLHDGDNFIAAGAKTSLARFPLDLDVKPQLPPISGRLCVLCLISTLRSKRLRTLERGAGKERLLQALDASIRADRFDIEFEEEASLANPAAMLDEELKEDNSGKKK